MQHALPINLHDSGSDTECCPNDWTFKPVFGVVHTSGCSTCNSYMTHLIIAHDSNNASFQVALRDRECLVSKAFLDGVQNGYQLQQEHDKPVLDRCRGELESALDKLEQHQKLLDAAKKEIGVLQDRALALQMQLDDSVSSSITLTKRQTQCDSSLIERLLLSSSEDVDYSDALSPLLSTTDKDPLPTFPDPPTVSGDAAIAPSASVSPDHVDSLGKMNPLAEHPPVTPKLQSPTLSPATHIQRPEPPTPNHAKPTSEPMPKPPTMPSASTSFPIQTAQSPSSITTVAQLQALMDAAHSGDSSALKRVKLFSGMAYQTPVGKRAELQHYVVKHWRKTPRSPPAPVARKGGDVFRPEIYVDASQWGIGFVMDGMWSAWKFSDSLVPSGNQIDISWAEMIAVEVGLWTVIHWVALMVQRDEEETPLEIVVRSDNTGVVKAIEKRQSSHPRQQDLLQRIFEAVRVFNVQLTPRWIASAQNLADDPSRGVDCHGATQLPFIPSLPSYLSQILTPISTNK